MQFGPVIIHVLASSILCFPSLSNFNLLPWVDWEKVGTKLGLENFQEWVDFIEQGSTMTIDIARKVVNNSNASVSLRVTASIFILYNDVDKNYILCATLIDNILQ